MRKVNYIAFVLVGILGSACETEPIIFTGPYFVRFTETSLSTKESNSKPSSY
jgi:hypothetical protein